jgi:hypothetical protein
MLALAAALSLLACEDDSSALALLGDGCYLNSDCDAGLACVYQRCHTPCVTSADCPLAADGERLRCILGDKPAHVCQLEDERDCAYHSECPGKQVCGPDGECRDECLDDRDCVSGQVCLAQRVCADPEELDENGALRESPPPPEQTTGFPCAYDSQCLGKAPVGGPELVCKDGGCNYACYDTVDCEPNFVCEPDDGQVTTPGACVPVGGIAYVNCVPGEQKECDCFPSGKGVQICDGSGSMFLACTDSGGDCSPP